VCDTVELQVARRFAEPQNAPVKVNLYRDYEVCALAAALRATADGPACVVETVMVGDSYFMTHLGRSSTRLDTAAERSEGFEQLRALVAEVRIALDSEFPLATRPLLVADFPEGSASDVGSALVSARAMAAAGADLFKLEIVSEHCLSIVDALARAGYAVMGHIGYTPQAGVSRRYGDTLEEALALFTAARRIRAAGAVSLVLERVAAPVHQALALYARGRMQMYGIFSGQASYGGQCLNIWDSVFKPPFTAHFFPPTATLTRESFPAAYTVETIAGHFAALLRLTAAREYPRSPRPHLSTFDLEALAAIDPWREHPAAPTTSTPLLRAAGERP